MLLPTVKMQMPKGGSYFVSTPQNIKPHNLLQTDFFKIMSDILLFEA